MATYKNDYTKKEDEALWEIHEVRNKITNLRKNRSIAEMNNCGKKLYSEWKNKLIKHE